MGKNVGGFSAYASLHRYFALVEHTEPTQAQRAEAVGYLCRLYGADTEEEILQKGGTELAATYLELKDKILGSVQV